MISFIRNLIKERYLVLTGSTKDEAKAEISKDKNEAPSPRP